MQDTGTRFTIKWHLVSEYIRALSSILFLLLNNIVCTFTLTLCSAEGQSSFWQDVLSWLGDREVAEPYASLAGRQQQNKRSAWTLPSVRVCKFDTISWHSCVNNQKFKHIINNSTLTHRWHWYNFFRQDRRGRTGGRNMRICSHPGFFTAYWEYFGRNLE